MRQTLLLACLRVGDAPHSASPATSGLPPQLCSLGSSHRNLLSETGHGLTLPQEGATSLTSPHTLNVAFVTFPHGLALSDKNVGNMGSPSAGRGFPSGRRSTDTGSANVTAVNTHF